MAEDGSISRSLGSSFLSFSLTHLSTPSSQEGARNPERETELHRNLPGVHSGPVWDLLIRLQLFAFFELCSKLCPFPEPLRPAVGPRVCKYALVNLLLH